MSCEMFCEAKHCNYPSGCRGGAWSRQKVRSGTGDDWMSREARSWGKATQTGPRDMDLVLAEHRGLRVVHPIRHGSLSSKVQVAAADVFDRMWTCARGAMGIMLHRISIEYEAPVDGSCAGAWLLTCDECFESAIGGLWGVEGKE